MGKNLLLRFDGDVVVRSHLRMNGRWRVRRHTDPGWRGSPWLVLRGREWEATQWNGPVLALGDDAARGLGPDLLAPETMPAELVSRLRRIDQSRLVGDALVDQRIVAGIGNMWLAETLWHARVSPWSQLGDVDDDELESALGWAQARDARIRRRASDPGDPSIAEPDVDVVGAGSPCAHAVSEMRTGRRTGARDASRAPVQRRGRDSNPRRADYHP